MNNGPSLKAPAFSDLKDTLVLICIAVATVILGLGHVLLRDEITQTYLALIGAVSLKHTVSVVRNGKTNGKETNPNG